MNTNDTFINIYKYAGTASLFELTLGQPLDRIKIEHQSNNLNNKLSNKWYHNRSLNYWYAGNFTSIIQRCGIYLPMIYISNNMFDKISVKATLTPTQELLTKPLFVSGVITPYVCFFEGIKTAQQKLVYPVTRLSDIIKFNVVTGNTSRLFASFIPTYGREYFFIMGMCSLQPYLLDIMDNWILSSCASAFISQTISQPLDVIKTKKELFPDKTLFGIKKMISIDIAHLNFTGKVTYFYQGWIARTTRGAWTFFCMNYIVNKLSTYNDTEYV
jgi:hypothetical protein